VDERHAGALAGNVRTPVSVIGLGPMGRALAGAFIRRGHPTTVWNRTAGKADALVAQGAVLARTVAEAADASSLVVVCVLDGSAVRAIVEAAGGALNGKTLVNLTSDTPGRARELAEWAAERGIEYLDGAILTPSTTIGEAAAVVVYSGSPDLFAACRPVLASLGGMAIHLGADPGRAAAYDVSLLDMYWTFVSGCVHALALARAEGIAAQELAAYSQGLAAILPGIVGGFARQIDEGRYPGDRSSLASAAAGMEHVIAAAEVHGIDTAVLRAAEAGVRRAVDAGFGGDGFARLNEMLRRQTG
jgi:3-hydroxyisobutyrate dehydrogenase-like beta-hydroxyacid dehydrogenase